jgi:hypothetical protein
VQDALDDLGLPGASNWICWSSQCSSHSGSGRRLWMVSRGNSAVHVQVGRVQRLRRAARAGHQHADLGEGGLGFVAELLHRRFM